MGPELFPGEVTKIKVKIRAGCLTISDHTTPTLLSLIAHVSTSFNYQSIIPYCPLQPSVYICLKISYIVRVDLINNINIFLIYN